MSNPAFSHITLATTDGVAHLVLNRPDKLNVLGFGPGSSRDEIALAIAIADADEAAGAILISAAGRAFCAGGDLSAIGAAGPETPLSNHLLNEEILRFQAAVRGAHKPVLAAVNGLCLGTALGFIVQCDFVIAASDARFGLIEGRMGHPGATDLVPVIGPAWAKFLIMTGELIDAARAERIGLVLAVEPTEALLARTTDLAQRIARMPREGVLLNKAAINNVAEVIGRAAGRLVGRAHDAMTKSMSAAARAPDGRYFEEILKTEGVEGLKRARDLQYRDAWLPQLDRD
jgi:enoyl-CoA hydratase/carnithine racemase